MNDFRIFAAAPAIFLAFTFGTAQAEHVYVANNDVVGSVSVIDTATNTVTATILAGSGPDGIAITPNGDKAYISNSADATVAVVSTATNTVLSSIPIELSIGPSVASPDGSTIYIVDRDNSQIYVIDTATDRNRPTALVGGDRTAGIAISPDGSTLYLANQGDNTIQAISTRTFLTTTTINISQIPNGVAVSPNGKLVYAVSAEANGSGGSVSVIDVGTATVTATIPVGNEPLCVAFTPDVSRAYVPNQSDNAVSVIDVDKSAVVATIPKITAPDGVAVTPDGRTVYFPANVEKGTVTAVDVATSQVVATIDVYPFPGAIAVVPQRAAPLAASVLPGSRSTQTGSTATVFATMLNAGTNTLSGCYIALPGDASPGLTLDYQTTNPATNALTGKANTPTNIAAGGAESFVLSFSSETDGSVTAQQVVYACSGVEPAASIPGVNTIDLLFSATPVIDIVALAATVTGDGTVHVPVDGTGAFAVATIDVGAGGAINVSVDTGDASLPVTLSLCQTEPSTGQCLAPPAATVPVSFATEDAPTFSIFVSSAGSISFAPGPSRIFARFKDISGASHGSTSVAVTTD